MDCAWIASSKRCNSLFPLRQAARSASLWLQGISVSARPCMRQIGTSASRTAAMGLVSFTR